eukprot:209484-Rhodomonas_salina.1
MNRVMGGWLLSEAGTADEMEEHETMEVGQRHSYVQLTSKETSFQVVFEADEGTAMEKALSTGRETRATSDLHDGVGVNQSSRQQRPSQPNMFGHRNAHSPAVRCENVVGSMNRDVSSQVTC